MEGAMPNTPLDREEDKKEIFARVWKRVMGDHTDACPITWEETGGDQAQTTTEQQQTLVTEEAAQTEEKTVLPAPHVPRGGQRLHSDFPRDDAQGVLGPQCLDCAPLGGLFSHLRGALLAGGGEVPAGDFVLRDSPPAVCPGAGHRGRLSHRHGDHHGPLPPAVVLGARQGGLGPGL